MAKHLSIETFSVSDVASEVRSRARPRSQWLQLRISERRVLLVVGDMFASAASVFASLFIWALVAQRPFTMVFIVRHGYWFFVLPILWYILASANDYYNLRVAARLRSSLKRLAQITLQLLIAYLTIFFVSPRDALPRLFIVYYAIVSLAIIGIWRAARLFLVGWTGFRRRALVVGVGHAADVIRQIVRQEAQGDYEIVGCVTSSEDDVPANGGANVVGTVGALPQLVARLGISELIVTHINAVPADTFQGVMACYTQGVAIMPMPILYEQITGRVPIEHVGEHLWSLVLPFEGETLAFNVYLLVKRIIDILLALIGLTVYAVLLPLLALAIRLDSPGPIYYRQVRVGRGGALFTMIKLRSMCHNAEGDSGPRWADAEDPRVTRVGKWLRKTRLDEVPQLLNVLHGEMTIVGPRPERPIFVDLLASEIPFYRSRLVVKPGVTGWAQVRYPYGSSTEDALRKLQYDLYYIRHQSFMLDLLIILKTFGTMLTLQGT